MITNLGWEPTEQGLARALGLHHVRLLNDLEAIANAIPELLPEEADVLLSGTPARAGAIAVVAPGTGLGEAFLVRSGARFSAHPSEGGHCDFGPVDDEQVELYHWCASSLRTRQLRAGVLGHRTAEPVCVRARQRPRARSLRASQRRWRRCGTRPR